MTAPTPTTPQRPPYLWALATAVVIFAIYLVTLAPTTAFWDTSEYIAAAKVLGIPHPPGNPLFVILAHAFGLLPLAASYAVRINLFAATTSAAAAGLWFLVTERWLRGIVQVRWARYAAAFAGVLVGATSWSVWNQSTVNEKVYTVSLLSIAVVMWLVVRWGDDEPGSHRDRWLVLIAYVLALTSTNHLMGFLALPALGVYVAWTDWRTVIKPWAIVTFYALLLAVSSNVIPLLHPGSSDKGIVLVVVSLLVLGYALWRSPKDPLVYLGLAAVIVGVSLNYLWLPLRAAQYPPINEGEPIGFFSQPLSDVLNRVQYGKPPLGQRMAPFTSQLANFWQYFSWQFARDWGAVANIATGVFTAIGLFGLWTLWKKDRRAGLAAVALLGTLSVALVFYMNFKYGYSLYPDNRTLPTEVRERDYFFIGSFAVFGAFVALGFGAIMQAIVSAFRDRGSATSRWATASLILPLGLVPFFGNRATASRAHETVARDFAYDILQSVDPYGILITAGDNDTFPLWYAQEVEGVRPDVTLANLSLMNTTWHLHQLHRRETPAFDPAEAAALWRNGPVPPRPTTPALAMSVNQIDSLPPAMQTPDKTLAFDGIQVTLGQNYLMLQDLATLFLIRDNIGKRSIHFSWSDGGYPDQTFGLSQYLVTQGLVRKLMNHPVEPNDSIALNPQIGYVNVPRTKALLSDVYHWKAAARPRPHGWVDPPSGSILNLYEVVYSNAARTVEARGDTALARKYDSIATAVSRELVAR